MSYLSLILTAATGAGLLTVYNYIMAEKLQGDKCITALLTQYILRHALHVLVTCSDLFYLSCDNVNAQGARSQRQL